MPRRTYSSAQKREAVALARVIGAEAASAQLGIGGKDTLRRWLLEAGDPPELQGSAEGWARLLDLAQSKVESILAGGKLSAVQIASIAGIAERNLREIAKAERKPAEPESWSTRFDRWCTERFPDKHQRELAKGVPQRVLRVALYGKPHDPSDASEWSDETDAEADERSFQWACGMVQAAGDLEAFDAEYRRWADEDLHRSRVISKRADVLKSSGMPYHLARAMAEELSEDVAVSLPAWAIETDPYVAPEALSDDDLDTAIQRLASYEDPAA